MKRKLGQTSQKRSEARQILNLVTKQKRFVKIMVPTLVSVWKIANSNKYFDMFLFLTYFVFAWKRLQKFRDPEMQNLIFQNHPSVYHYWHFASTTLPVPKYKRQSSMYLILKMYLFEKISGWIRQTNLVNYLLSRSGYCYTPTALIIQSFNIRKSDSKISLVANLN